MQNWTQRLHKWCLNFQFRFLRVQKVLKENQLKKFGEHYKYQITIGCSQWEEEEGGDKKYPMNGKLSVIVCEIFGENQFWGLDRAK